MAIVSSISTRIHLIYLLMFGKSLQFERSLLCIGIDG